jgi:tetratricopeptide (TPR) repeat protein
MEWMPRDRSDNPKIEHAMMPHDPFPHSSRWAIWLLTFGAFSHASSALAEPSKDAAGASTPAVEEPASPTTDGSSKEGVQEAGKHYARGLSLYSEGDFALAVIEFDRAYALVSDYRVLYNIGQVRIQLGNNAKARQALERYLAEGGGKVAAQRLSAVTADLEMLAARTATLRVETNVDGALIFIDDVPMGTSPLLEPILLDAGDHRLTLKKLGFNQADSRLTLAGGDATSARLDLVPEARAAASRIVVEKRYLEKSDRGAWIWATWSATSVFAVSGVTTAALGLKAANDLDRLRQSDQTNRGELDSTQRRARTLLVTGDVLGAAAIVSGGVALYLTLANRAESAKTAASRERRPHVDLALGSNWLGLKGSY